MMAILALTLALMGVSMVRQGDSQPLRTDSMELRELLALLRAVGSEPRPAGEGAALVDGYPREDRLPSEAELLEKRDLPRLGVSIFRSSPSRFTDSKTYKDTGRCRVSYMPERRSGIHA